MWEEIRKIKERMAYLSKQISDLYINVEQLLQRPLCPCECKVQPHYREATISYYYIDENGDTQNLTQEELNLNDRFPLPACAEEKGILFLSDVVIFCSYHTEDGWIVRCALNRP